jgi:hypothetical protein
MTFGWPATVYLPSTAFSRSPSSLAGAGVGAGVGAGFGAAGFAFAGACGLEELFCGLLAGLLVFTCAAAGMVASAANPMMANRDSFILLFLTSLLI